MFHSIKSKCFHLISSYIRDLITFDHLSDKNQVQFMQEHIILFHGSS